MKTKQENAWRMKSRVTNFNAFIKELLQKNVISSACEMLKSTFMMNKEKGKGFKYSPELKSCALTLQFYSSKAYEFVRRTCNLALPHPAQFRWYSKVPAEPGFTEPAFHDLRSKVEE